MVNVKLYLEEAEGPVIVRQLLERVYKVLAKQESFVAKREHANYCGPNAELNLWNWISYNE